MGRDHVVNTLRRSSFGVLAALFALVVLPGQALAGNATGINVTLPAAKVAITGKVTKHGDGALSGALVGLVIPGKTGMAAFAITDAGGHFTFIGTANGDYRVV